MDSKLSALTAITALADEDLVYVAQGDVSKKMTGSQLKTYVGASAGTDTPILTGNSTGSEETELIVTVTNWNSDQLLTISVEAGSYLDNDDGTITWTLPAFTGVDDSHDMSVQATEPSHSISAIATHTVSVTEVTEPVPDQTILYENATINGTTFPDLVNASVATNNIVATADTASASSIKTEQDGIDTDFTNATPTADNTAINFTLDGAPTNIEVIVSGLALTDGDTLLLNDGAVTTLQEFDTTGHVTQTGNDVVSSTDPFGDGSLIAKYELNGDADDTTTTYNGTPTSITYNDTDKIYGSDSALFNVTNSKIVSAAPGVKSASLFVKRDSTANGGGSATLSYLIEARQSGGSGYVRTVGTGGTELNSVACAVKINNVSVANGDPINNDVWEHYYIEFDSLESTIAIGNNIGGDAGYGGLMDQIEFYNRALTSGEIDILMKQTPEATVDLTTAGLTSAPTTVCRDTANISTSLVGTGAGDSFVARTAQSHTADIATTPALITDIFDTDTRTGRDFKVKAELAKLDDTVSRISIPIQKLA